MADLFDISGQEAGPNATAQVLGAPTETLAPAADPGLSVDKVPISPDSTVSPPEDDPRYKAVFYKREKMEGYEAADKAIKQQQPPEKQTLETENDPHGISLTEIVNDAAHYAAYDITHGADLVWRGAKDIGAGLTVELPRALYGGVADGWNETLKSLDSAMQWVGTEFQKGIGFSPEKIQQLAADRTAAGGDNVMQKALSLPEADKTENNTASIIRGMTQFALAFMPIARGAKAIGFGEKLASTFAAGATSAIAFAPAEKGLTDLIDNTLSYDGKKFLEGPISDFMTTDPNDPEGINRLKNGIKGALGGVAADYVAAGLGRLLNAVKQNRINNGIKMRSADSGEGTKVRDETLLGSTKNPVVDEATASKLIDGTHTIDDLKGINWEKVKDAKSVGELVKYLVNGSEANAAITGGTKITAQEAAKQLSDAATLRLKDIAKTAAESTDGAELMDFARMMKVAGGLGKFASGDLEGAAAALKASQNKLPKGKNYFAQLDSNLMDEGGPVQLRKVARIVKGMENTPAALVKAAQLARGSAVGNAIQSYWYFDLLSGLMTQAANVTGTVANTLTAIPTRFLASGTSEAIGSSSIALGEAPAMLYGMVRSVNGAMKGFSKTWRTMTSEFDSNSINEQRLFNMEVNGLPVSSKRFNMGTPDTALGKLFTNAVDGFGQVLASPTRALMATDEFFKSINNQMEMHALAYRKAVIDENLQGKDAWNRMRDILVNPSEEMLEGAANYATKTTFNAPLDSAGNNLSSLLNKWPITKAFIPFHKIAINLTKWTAENSPLGLLSSNIRNTIAAAGPEGDIAMTKLAMGSMASMAVVDLAMQDKITAAGPRDPALRANWLLTHQPWSIRHTAEDGTVTWTPYNRISPHGILMGMAASMGETYHLMKDEDVEKIAGAMAMSTSRAFLNSSFMKGLADLFEAVDSHSVEGFQRYVNEQVATFTVPGIIKTAKDIADPVWRDAVEWNDAIAARIPGYLNVIGVEGSDSLPAVQNIWGDAIETPGNALERAIVPVVSKDMAPDPVNDFIVDNKVSLAKPSKTQHDVELTPHEYADFTKAAGAPAKAELDRLFAGKHPLSASFNKQTDGPDGGKALMIGQIVQAHRAAASAKLLNNPDFKARFEATVAAKAQALRGSGQSKGVSFGP